MATDSSPGRVESGTATPQCLEAVELMTITGQGAF